jgi:hypothetical protein
LVAQTIYSMKQILIYTKNEVSPSLTQDEP